MSTSKDPTFETARAVYDRCLCFHLQRAARSIARAFDDAFRPLGLTNGQYSLLMSLNRPEAPTMGQIARTLATDRTSLTASLKPLERRGLVDVKPDAEDRRRRRLVLTQAGRDLLAQAVPIWRTTHDEIDAALGEGGIAALRSGLIEARGLHAAIDQKAPATSD